MESQEIARQVAALTVKHVRDLLGQKLKVVLVTSAGRTLSDTYAVMSRDYRQALDWSRVICVQMDEYENVGSDDPSSLAAQLDRELIAPLRIGRFIRFQDAAGVPFCSLEHYEKQLRDLGGIDFSIHGVGRNGHIGFNEPDATTRLETRAVSLADSTREANGVQFSRGVTLGLGILSEARTSIAVLLGRGKLEAARMLLCQPAGHGNPVAHLKQCEQLYVFVDSEATPEQLNT